MPGPPGPCSPAYGGRAGDSHALRRHVAERHAGYPAAGGVRSGLLHSPATAVAFVCSSCALHSSTAGYPPAGGKVSAVIPAEWLRAVCAFATPLLRSQGRPAAACRLTCARPATKCNECTECNEPRSYPPQQGPCAIAQSRATWPCALAGDDTQFSAASWRVGSERAAAFVHSLLQGLLHSRALRQDRC
jgi:hypothetical protein